MSLTRALHTAILRVASDDPLSHVLWIHASRFQVSPFTFNPVAPRAIEPSQCSPALLRLLKVSSLRPASYHLCNCYRYSCMYALPAVHLHACRNPMPSCFPSSALSMTSLESHSCSAARRACSHCHDKVCDTLSSNAAQASVLDSHLRVALALLLLRLLNANMSCRPPHVARRHLPQPHSPIVPRRRQNRPTRTVSPDSPTQKRSTHPVTFHSTLPTVDLSRKSSSEHEASGTRRHPLVVVKVAHDGCRPPTVAVLAVQVLARRRRPHAPYAHMPVP